MFLRSLHLHHYFMVTGSYMPPGPPNGAHKTGLHPAGYPMPRVPIPPYHGAPQPYAIPTRGAVHGPFGSVPHVPPPANRGFGSGRGNAGHIPHQQQQPIGAGMGSSFNFSMENPNSQPSPGGPLSQPGYVTNVSTFIILLLDSPIILDLSLTLLFHVIDDSRPKSGFSGWVFCWRHVTGIVYQLTNDFHMLT